ncbi:bacillithiol biosynthesis deacetylase BshB1 [Lacibacter cauensis]|uniref:Bacillithiol biosynthesis deacetylase BshB1 n=1 Tax=Lacibacter cauensis TaxID=510947 RepID=A0A562SVZ1_9BACT|nr:bacillithiol biosynthesis deacetylase BshB1 [Lacibacter cauensis]TWI85333.1 bacillithiol biosynthesis deacetylase BshB1 [Lacibacter cauensis]
MKLDILAFGVHPDDVELSCAGTLMVEINNGKKVGVIDLTRGELGTRGTAETRRQEAAVAAEIMGVHVRENLGMRDGFFKNDEEHQLQIIQKIRQYQPEIVICNAIEDRHPDHGRSSKLVSDASFLSGLRKIETALDGVAQEAWRPKYVFHYIQDRYAEPDFIFDITSVFNRKVESIKAYGTQFSNASVNPNDDEPQTYISTPAYFDTIISRHKMLGKRIGVEYGEGFITEKRIGIRSFDALIQITT